MDILRQLRDEVENILKKTDIPLSVRGIWLVAKTVNGLEGFMEEDVSRALETIQRQNVGSNIKVTTETTTLYELVK